MVEKLYLRARKPKRNLKRPFVVSTDGLLGREAKIVLQHLSAKIAENAGVPYSVVCGYVTARFSIAIASATNRCLRGSRVPTSRLPVKL